MTCSLHAGQELSIRKLLTKATRKQWKLEETTPDGFLICACLGTQAGGEQCSSKADLVFVTCHQHRSGDAKLRRTLSKAELTRYNSRKAFQLSTTRDKIAEALRPAYAVRNEPCTTNPRWSIKANSLASAAQLKPMPMKTRKNAKAYIRACARHTRSHKFTCHEHQDLEEETRCLIHVAPRRLSANPGASTALLLMCSRSTRTL